MLHTFLSALFDEPYIELRALPSRAQAWINDPQDAWAFTQEHKNQNLYFGVANRRRAGQGDLQNCDRLWALFVDIDFKSKPEAEAKAAVERFPLPPSIVVRSGGGRHLYWLLREPFDLSTEAAKARDLLRRLALFLGADVGVGEPARILRLPWTFNYKYTPPALVYLAYMDSDARYNASEFEELLPPEPKSSTAIVLPEIIPPGERNNTLYRIGRSLRYKGLSPSSILAVLSIENRNRCHPPMPDHELKSLVDNVIKQPFRERSRLEQ